ncbi:MAG: hypothetical protein DMF75_17320 [Acidobacteria bacterium]|nr:MAG: hypothetical protein DMF75_17320 [Acidobacteriota bacterium]
MNNNTWPSLVLGEWQDTLATLHMWTQIVGKIRLKLTPLVNHWWNAPLYVSARGMTTSPMTYEDRIFEIEFDFIDHQLRVECSDGALTTLSLRPQSVADFYQELMTALHDLEIDVKIWPMPVEIPNPIRFDQDHTHKSYDAEYVNRFWHALVNIDEVFKEFRARFIGKVSPVHFWWGSFDHAVTRFSGRPAPPREGADKMTQEAYSHEVISHGFWLGGNGVEAMFYAYSAPEPAGFSESRIKPAEAFYSQDMKEFFLPYDAVRQSALPEANLMDFLQSTYEAGANLAKWDRKALER